MTQFINNPAKEKQLLDALEAEGAAPETLEEQFIRSSGNGGQNLNRVATCVRLLHIPTGIVVKCQIERTQRLNRYRARQILLDKLLSLKGSHMSPSGKKRDQIRKQKKRRLRRSKSKNAPNGE